MSILKLQKQAIRLTTSSPYRSESAPLYKSLQILSVFQVYVFKLSVLMFKFVNGAIEFIKNMFSIYKETNDHFSRQSNKLHVPKCNKASTQTNVSFRGVKIWTNICGMVYFHCSLSCSKCNLKEFLIHCSPYNQMHSCISLGPWTDPWSHFLNPMQGPGMSIRFVIFTFICIAMTTTSTCICNVWSLKGNQHRCFCFNFSVQIHVQCKYVYD